MKKKVVALCLAGSILLGMSACSHVPAVASEDSRIIIEAMWSAGGGAFGDGEERVKRTQEYKNAVSEASYRYAAVMDENCRTKAPFDVSSVAKAYHVYTPAGLEPVRDKWLRKQIAMMACVTKHPDTGERLAANLDS